MDARLAVFVGVLGITTLRALPGEMQTIDTEICKLDGAHSRIAIALDEKSRPASRIAGRSFRDVYEYATPSRPDFVPVCQLM